MLGYAPLTQPTGPRVCSRKKKRPVYSPNRLNCAKFWAICITASIYMSQVLIQQYLNQLRDLRKVAGTHRESVVREAFKVVLTDSPLPAAPSIAKDVLLDLFLP